MIVFVGYDVRMSAVKSLFAGWLTYYWNEAIPVIDIINCAFFFLLSHIKMSNMKYVYSLI